MGVIALDIDGTVAGLDHHIPEPVATYLDGVRESGWQIAFVTGRTYNYAWTTLKDLAFPFLFAPENGATLLQMPERSILRKSYFEQERLTELERASAQIGTDIVLHTGIEEGGSCYYRPKRLGQGLLTYLKTREARSNEPWYPVDDFPRDQHSYFAYAKCFGKSEELHLFVSHLSNHGRWAVSVISDPLRPGYAVALITHPDAGKGGVVRVLRDLFGGPVIAAGDDFNDLPMLQEADYSIAMEGAPAPLLEIANIVAPPCDRCGIIEGVTRVLEGL